MKKIHFLNINLYIIVFGLTFLILFNCSKDKNPVSNFHENYPIIIRPLNDTELQGLKNQFHAKNPRVCSTLDKYGFTGIRKTCYGYNGEGIQGSDVNVEQMIRKAKEFIFINSQFTNVLDTSLLQIRQWRSTNISWWINNYFEVSFKEQVYKSLPVIDYNTRIKVKLDSLGVFSIEGYWYDEIYIPPVDQINVKDAKKEVVGIEIIWHDSGGSPLKFIVNENNLNYPVTKVIYPIKSDNSIELRIAWEIPVTIDDLIGWHIYFDTMKGEILQIIQEFRT